MLHVFYIKRHIDSFKVYFRKPNRLSSGCKVIELCRQHLQRAARSLAESFGGILLNSWIREPPTSITLFSVTVVNFVACNIEIPKLFSKFDKENP